MELDLSTPGWEWCGGCAGQKGHASAAEMQRILSLAEAALDHLPPPVVLAALSGVIQKAIAPTCRCSPFSLPNWSLIEEGEELFGSLPNPVEGRLAPQRDRPPLGSAGVYQLLSDSNEVLYVGMTSRLSARLRSHSVDPGKVGRGAIRWRAWITHDLRTRTAVEAFLIAQLNPRLNVTGRTS